jgi:hypothetical protein
MTESDWLACTDPASLLSSLWRGSGWGRKARLFACACCRHGWPLPDDQCSREGVRAAEQWADNRLLPGEVAAARAAAAAARAEPAPAGREVPEHSCRGHRLCPSGKGARVVNLGKQVGSSKEPRSRAEGPGVIGRFSRREGGHHGDHEYR